MYPKTSTLALSATAGRGRGFRGLLGLATALLMAHATAALGAPAGTLSRVSPNPAAAGDTIVLSGTKLLPTEAGGWDVSVRYGAASNPRPQGSLDTTDWSHTRVKAVLPATLPPGRYWLAVYHNDERATNTVSLQVRPALRLQPPPKSQLAPPTKSVAPAKPLSPPAASQVIKAPKLPTPITPVGRPTGCPDLAVPEIKVRARKSGSGDLDYRVMFEVKLRNLGTLDYESAANPVLMLSLNPPGGSPQIIKSWTVQNLRRGASRSYYSPHIPWSLSAEFPPDIAAQLNYDPDFANDASRANDDCNMRNNRLVLRASDVNRQIR